MIAPEILQRREVGMVSPPRPSSEEGCEDPKSSESETGWALSAMSHYTWEQSNRSFCLGFLSTPLDPI